jgi:hypothetical protein
VKGLARDGTRWPSGARSHPSQTVQVAGEHQEYSVLLPLENQCALFHILGSGRGWLAGRIRRLCNVRWLGERALGQCEDRSIKRRWVR